MERLLVQGEHSVQEDSGNRFHNLDLKIAQVGAESNTIRGNSAYEADMCYGDGYTGFLVSGCEQSFR